MQNKKSLKAFCLGCAGKLLRGVLAFLIFLCMFSLLGQGEWGGYAIEHYSGTDGYLEQDWVLRSQGETVIPRVELPMFLELETGREYSLSTVLTYDGKADNLPYCFFYIHHMYCKAYLDGQEIFSYTPEDLQGKLAARSPGNVHVGLPMPEDCQGKTFEIRFMPLLRIRMDYELPYATFGDYPTMLHSQFYEDLPHNIVAVLSAFVGAVSVLFSAMVLSGKEYREGTFIGIFALVFSAYNMTECPFNLYLLSNPFYVYLANYSTFTLLPVTLMTFLREKFTRKSHRRACLAAALAGSVLLAAEWTLHFTGLFDMREFLPFIHAAYLADLILLIVLFVTMEKGKEKRALVMQMLPIMVGMVMDGFNYYLHLELSPSDAAFSSMGVVIFLLMELWHVWRSSIDIYTESIRSHYYQEMAYEDKLTGVGNRRAFEAEKMELTTGVQKHKSIIVASADVNDLKTVNDTMGHAEGDYLITSTAQVLAAMTGDEGKTFRTGGDEFILFFYDITEEEVERRMDLARASVQALNQSGRAYLSIAFGYVKAEDLDLESAVQKADREMYMDKSQKKEYIHRTVK